MMERKQVTMMLNADEAEFLRNAIVQAADKYYYSISFAEDLARYVDSRLSEPFEEELT